MYSYQFEQAWQLYPRKAGKALAYKKFNKALKRATYEAIIDGITGYIEYTKGTEPRFICHFSTWIHQDRWLDDYSALTADNCSQSQTGISMDAAVKTVQKNSTQMEREETDLGELFRIPTSR